MVTSRLRDLPGIWEDAASEGPVTPVPDTDKRGLQEEASGRGFREGHRTWGPHNNHSRHHLPPKLPS